MPILEVASVDDLLGPREGRFLGEGFKRVEHSLSELTVSPGAPGVGGIEATAGIDVVGLWSRKGARRQKPHLSTIDAMLFATRLTGLYAAHAFTLAPDAGFTVECVDLKAGSSPDEDELDMFPVSGRLVAADRTGGAWSTTLECRIGSMTARVRARHGAGRAPARTADLYRRAEELPGPWNDAPFGIPHRTREQLLTAVRVTADGAGDLQASAHVTLAPGRAPVAPDGIRDAGRGRLGARPAGEPGSEPGGASSGAPKGAPPDSPATMIDAFIAAMQLGQVLLYTLDGIERAGSNNLWMRRTRVTAGPAPARPGDEVTARLERAMLLPSSAGTWRSADVVGSLHGVESRAGVAHLLPASRPRSTPLERWRS
ncbi:AvrD family protein [Actinacidiphila rubida]|uniref:Avirulence D protein (AvrD) n=1 Tax=Actinacidiphila rubida TaxID=310780 RepID=A0A1H8E904_9ACTN|nr:AvrD family protein [Actinacidiphila rubida]SEN15604.1 avirulence D protein (AvrD) [Actinacidiphila rubida]